MKYTEKVMDHFLHPRNMGELDHPTASGQVGNPVCGDIMKIDLDIEDGIIKDVKFKTFGCGTAIATSSISTEMIKGKTVDEALELTNKSVADALDGLPPVKMHCSVLAEQAIKVALKKYFEERGELTPEREAKFAILDEEDEASCPSAYTYVNSDKEHKEEK
ncbi:MAG: Fe-S cluster assembly scaffold protein NifU [Eubacteriales bacterium]|nr:Fe-S cluster assembly scaffold protein NifU [Eubacteriales bacterium]